jgi:hypothetical protein
MPLIVNHGGNPPFRSAEEADAGVIVRSSRFLLSNLAASPKIGDPANYSTLAQRLT